MNVRAVIMAGGQGTRLRPLTARRPKPLVPVAGRPVIDYALELLARHGFEAVTITVQYLPEAIIAHVGDGSRYGLRVTYAREPQPLGTAGSVRNAAGDHPGPVLVMSGDCLTDFDLGAFLEAHSRSGAVVTLALTRVTRPLEYGVVITDAGGRVLKFLEKPSWGEVFSDTVNTGIYLLEPEAVAAIPPARPYDFSRDLFPALLGGGQALRGETLVGYWCDIGDLAQYRAAQLDALEGRVRLSLPGRQLWPGVWVGTGAVIEGTVEAPAVVGAGARVEAGAVVQAGSVIGAQGVLRAGARVRGATLWDGVRLGEGSEVLEAVVGERTRLDRDSAVYARAVVGDEAVVGAGARVGPGARVWPGRHLPPGLVLDRDLPPERAPAARLYGAELRGELNADLLVEDACRLGQAAAALGGPLAVGHGGEAPARAVAAALEAGCWAAGQDTYRLGVAFPELVRFGTRAYGAVAGAYVGNIGGVLVVRFFGAEGTDLDGPGQRRLLQALEWPAGKPNRAGRGRALRSLGAAYAGWVLRTAGRPPQPVRAEVELTGPAAATARRTARRLGWHARQGPQVRWRGDGLWLELESGKVLNDDELTVLAAQRFFQSGGRELAVPVHAPSVLEALAAADGGRVVRLPAGRLGTAGRDYHIQVGPGRVPQSVFWSDSLLRMAYVLAGLPSEEALAAIPPLYRVTCSVDCPWELTGQVMRNLVTSAAGTVEMIEGVRTRHARGWTLARPDGLTPSYRIWADGESMEIARELAATLAERVQSLVAAQEPATPESSGTCV